MTNDLALSLKKILLEFLAPMRESATNPRLLDEWLASLGYTRAITRDPALTQLVSQAEAIGKALEALDDTKLDSWDAVQDIVGIAQRIPDIRTNLQQFASDASRVQIAGSLPGEIMDSLLATWLRRKHPLVFRAGSALGIIRPRETATADPIVVVDDVTQRYQRSLDTFEFSQIGKIASSPGPTLAEMYLPNGLTLAADTVVAKHRLFTVLGWLANELGLSWRVQNRAGTALPPVSGPDDSPPEEVPLPSMGEGDEPAAPPPPSPLPAYFTESFPTFVVRLAGSGVNEARLELKASSAQHPGGVAGYLLTPTGTFQTSQSIGNWTLTLAATGALPSLAITSNGVDIASGSQAVAGGSATLSLRRQPPAQGAPAAFIAGNPTGTRLELNALEADAGLVFDTTRRALTLSLGTSKATLVIAASEGDGFLADVLPADGVKAVFDIGLLWASDTGISLRGSADLKVKIPVGRSVGGLTLSSLGLEVRADTTGVSADVTASIGANLGPIKAVIDGVGLTTSLKGAATGGNLGAANLSLGFKGPSGVGLSLDAHGVLTGGGFLAHDEATSTYAGVMQLALHDSITLTAFGLIATKMPDGRPGYSLLVFITADGFKPIPLGFGFVLQSLGGMLGVHRTFDVDVLKAGLKTDTLATLLFPKDPVANAPVLLQTLAAAFPIRRGSILVGLLARITWFTPTLVTLDLALILELGARTRLLVLGRVSALLPAADNDLIRLQLDTMGVLDFDAGTLEADAVLVDSRLVHQFPVTGSAALRARWGDASNFILAVGGVNPRFAAPAGFPVLERVAIALCAGKNPRLVCDAYFAITANTVQFGARASLYAEAAGFSVTGDIGYDALVTLLPPHFIVDFHAALQLKRGSTNLFKVTLDGTLEGPLPLRLSARAKFEILWFSYTVRFAFTLADGAAAAGVAAVALEDAVLAALADPTNWRTQVTAGSGHGVGLRAVAAGAAGQVLDPLGQLVVQQPVAPLNMSRDVETVGGAPVVGARRFALTGKLNQQAGTPVTSEFAPARYFVLSDDDALVAPSFETHDAGMVLGDTTVTYSAPALVAAPLTYAPITLSPLPAAGSAPQTLAPLSAPAPYVLPLAALKAQRTSGAAARAPVRRVGRARFRHVPAVPSATVRPPAWKIVKVADGSVAPVGPDVTTWSAYRAQLATLNRGGAQWVLVPAHEL